MGKNESFFSSSSCVGKSGRDGNETAWAWRASHSTSIHWLLCFHGDDAAERKFSLMELKFWCDALFQQLPFPAICCQLARKGLKSGESSMNKLSGKLAHKGEETSRALRVKDFPSFPLVCVPGEKRERNFYLCWSRERSCINFFIHSNFFILSTPFLLQHEKVFFKYLNYALKLNVFVFIFFFSRNIFIDFSRSRLYFFSRTSLKIL